jgi:putative peptidoglycan lipid II flippase
LPCRHGGSGLTSRFVKQSLVTASVITVGTSILSRVFGYAREAVIAGYFGTSSTLDIFIIAFTVPELITFIVFAALPMALMPSLRRHNLKQHEEESGVFWSGLIVFFVIFAGISILLYLFRNSIIAAMAPTITDAEHQLAVRLLSIVAPFAFFRGMEAYFRSWLFEKKQFVIPATSTIIVNVVILVLILWWYDSLHIAALAYGWLVASAILTLYNGYFAFKIIRPSAPTQLYPGTVNLVLKVTLSIAAIESIALIYPVVDRYLAVLYLGQGQIAALRYATFLIHIPTGMFVVAFTQASFPWISDFSAPDQRERLVRLYRDSVRLIIFVMGLIAVACVIFSTELVKVAFERGAFDAASLALTSSPFLYFALGVVFYSIYVFQIKFYYGGLTLFRLGAILSGMLVVKIILSYLLVHPMEQNGLALATAITWLVGCVVMTLDLERILKFSVARLLGVSFFKVLLSLILTAAFWMLLQRVWSGAPSASLVRVFVRLAAEGLLGIGFYLFVAYLLRIEELHRIFDILKRRLSSKAA